MKLKMKLSIIVIAFIITIISVSSVITLNRSRKLIIEAANDYAMQTAHTYAVSIKNSMEAYLRTAKTLAQIFGEYHTFSPETRRDNFDDILWSLMSRNENYTGIWTAWVPNALDNLDDQLGRYYTSYTRRNGPIERMSEGFEGWETFLSNVTEEAIITNPTWRTVAGHGEVPVVTIVYPIKSGGTNRIIGIVGINYITALQSITDSIRQGLYQGTGYAGVYTNDGIIVAHFDQSRIKNNIRDNPKEQALLGNRMNDVVAAIKNGGINGEPLTVNVYSQTLKTEVHNIYYPINIEDITTPWNLEVAIPMSEVTKGVRKLTIFIIIFTVVVIVIAAVVTFFLSGNIVHPIINVTCALKDISEGEGDLTKTIPIASHDEIGDLSRYFNATLGKIKGMVIMIKQQTATLSGIGSELASHMTETAAAINQITTNIQNIKNKVINQSAGVVETNATMEQITLHIEKLDEHIDKQTLNVSQSSSSIEEMIVNIKSVTQTLIKNGDNVLNLIESSGEGHIDLQEVAADLQEIARESEGLLEINAVMENIASQTNLLSMNAAIEAAHAGEAGKGFAVVADEIRKLAENSSEQSKTVSTVLKKIKESIDKITRSTDKVLMKFDAIDSGVKTVADQEENIRNAMEEQGEGSKQILDSLALLNGITRQVKDGSEEMLDGSKQIITESKNLEAVTQDIANEMNEMAIGANQINAAVHEVNRISEKNKENIDILVTEVSQFKV